MKTARERASAVGGGGEPPLNPAHPVEVGHLQGGAQLVGQVHRHRHPGPGQVHRQGEHMGHDGVALLVRQVGAQGGGVAQGELRVVQALVARVGGAVGGIVEVQVVEQATCKYNIDKLKKSEVRKL